MFDGIIREVVEEIGVPSPSLVKLSSLSWIWTSVIAIDSLYSFISASFI